MDFGFLAAVEGVRVWTAEVDDVDRSPGQGSLSAAELARAERLPSQLMRNRFLARRWMVRALLAEATGEDPGGLVLERRCERCGEPHPVSPLAAGPRRVWWSASSSAGLAAVAISPWRVGLDIESCAPRARWERIARRFYTDAEQRAVARSPTRFLEFWTMKEAFLKALGLGLSGGLRSIDCTSFSDAGSPWRTHPGHPGWQFAHLQPQPGFTASMAVQGAPRKLAVHRWAPAAALAVPR
jgi:4'-phosphopantetheinyl transferase